MLINIEFGAYPQQTQSFEVLSALTGHRDSNQKTEGKMQNQAVFAADFSSFLFCFGLHTEKPNVDTVIQETPEQKCSPGSLFGFFGCDVKGRCLHRAAHEKDGLDTDNNSNLHPAFFFPKHS